MISSNVGLDTLSLNSFKTFMTISSISKKLIFSLMNKLTAASFAAFKTVGYNPPFLPASYAAFKSGYFSKLKG